MYEVDGHIIILNGVVEGINLSILKSIIELFASMDALVSSTKVVYSPEEKSYTYLKNDEKINLPGYIILKNKIVNQFFTSTSIKLSLDESTTFKACCWAVYYFKTNSEAPSVKEKSDFIRFHEQFLNK